MFVDVVAAAATTNNKRHLPEFCWAIFFYNFVRMKFRHDSFNAKCDCATPMYKCARSYLTYCLRLCDRLRMVCVSLSSFSIICFSGCSFWSIKAFSLVNIRLVRSSMYLSSLVSFAYCRCAREWRKHFECNNFDMKRSVYCWVSIVIGLIGNIIYFRLMWIKKNVAKISSTFWVLIKPIFFHFSHLVYLIFNW